MMAARLCGGKVEVSGEKSETLQLWANPDGTLTAEKSAGPVRMRDAKGVWRAVDPTLQVDADGGVSAKAHPRGLKLAGQSGDGDHDVVRLGSGDDAVALQWAGRLPKPKLEGARATYSDVLDGVDLVIESTRGGYEQYFVVKTRDALSRSGRLNLRFRAAGQTVTPDGAGGLVFKDKRGRETGRMPQPSMWDAVVGEHSLDHLHLGEVQLAAAQRGGNIDLQLTPDPAFLAMKDLTFPITIDPSVTLLFDTFVQTGYTTDQSGGTELKLGYSDDGGSWTARSYLNWDTGFLAGAHVNSATVNLWETHSWSCTAAQWNVYTTWGPNTSTRWTAQPPLISLQGSSTQTKGYSSSCNDGWVSADIPGFFQEAANNSWGATGMGLIAANESNHNGWKRFSSSEGSNPPYAVVNFNAVPQVTSQQTDPSTQCVTGSGRPYVNKLQPKLRAQVTDPEGSPVSATFDWWTTGGSKIGSTTVGPQASGSMFEATVPAGAFTNGGTYSWQVRGTDGGTAGPYTGFCEFTVDTTEPGAQPGVSSATFPENTWTGSVTGYTASTASAAFVPGTTVLALTDDDNVEQVTLPFPVTFYGQTYTTAWVDTNGIMSFENPSRSHPDDFGQLPNAADPNGSIYVFGQDIWIDTLGSMRTATIGTAPNRTFIVEWNNFKHYADQTNRESAEIVLTEGSTTVRTNYTGIDNNDAEKGGLALVGVENATGTAATQYSYLTPSLANNTQVVFTYNAGTPPASAGTAASFTFTPSGVADVASYQYGVDTNPPATVVNAAAVGGNATVTITPDADGPHTLYVRSQDRAGNQSPIKAYQFNVGYGGLTSPRAGDISAGKVSLTAAASPSAADITYQWRRADTDSWQTIPAGDVVLAAGGGAVTWPLARSGGQFPKLTWSLDTTVNNAEAGPDPLDGPLQVRALFSGGASAPVKISYDRNQASAASSDVGPGSVNLLTGNLTLNDTDVSVDSYGSDLTVTRAFNTRRPAATDKASMYGPGWVSGVVVADAEAPYTNLTVTGSLVQVGLPGGDTLGFTERTTSASAKAYDSETGFEQLALSYASAGDAYTLSDYDGNVVVFTRVAGSAAGTYNPTSVSTPGSGQTTTIGWEKVTIAGAEVIRPTRTLAPVPTGITCGTLVKGCRALDFAYATATSATGTGQAQWGDYTGRVTQISFTAWDPDAAPAAMRTVVMARYSYDSNGRLRAVWDPRLDWTDTSVTPAVVRHLADTYDYDADGVVTTISPQGGDEPWQLSYTTIPGDPGKGRLAQVSRSALTAGTARHTVVYKVPLTGTGAPYDLSAAQTSRWGQAEQPVDATALFTPAQVPTGNQATGTMPATYDRATVTYLDPNGRTVDEVKPGGFTAATWYDAYGHTVRSLTAANRARALDASASDTAAAEATLAQRLSTVNVYSADGQELRETLGPEHDLVLGSGAVVRGRNHTVNAYDQGAPNTGGPFHLVTTSTVTAQYTGAGGTGTDADARTTTTGYDWPLRQPTIATLDATGLALATRTTYDANTGLTTSTTAPAGGATTNTPATRTTVYYRAGTGSGQSECDNHPEWANLACRVQPGGQAGSGPELPVTATTYDIYNNPRTVVQKTSAGAQRTTTSTYDAAGRVLTVAVAGVAGTGQAVPTRRNVYDAATGRNTRTQTLDGSGNVTAENIRAYDTLGRTTGYTDADTNASVTTYDLLSRPATVNDGKATRTYTYDGGAERRGLATGVADGQAGTFGGTYDADGRLTGQTWPNGIVVATGYDETGDERSITYTKPGCGQADCTLYTETVRSSAHGQQRDVTSSLAAQRYGYDNAGRLSTVNDTVANACTTRVYGYNTATDRTSLATYNPGSGGACQSTTAAGTTAWTYDSADRLTSTGYVYDVLGRATTVPAADTSNPGGGNLTAGYHVTDLVRTITQAGRTTTYTLDVGGERVRGWTDSDVTTTTAKTNHYTSDDDRPEWTDEAGGAWTRTVAGVGGPAATTTTFGVTDTDWQLVDLHGDVVATVHNTDAGLSTVDGSTEFGTERNAADTGNRRYGWLGAEQRAADTPSGLVLMGVRLYLPTIGRFLSVDPVVGGSCGAYDYTCADPRNNSDLDGKKNRPARRWGWPDWRRPLQQIGNKVASRIGGIVRWGVRTSNRVAIWMLGGWFSRVIHGLGCMGKHSTGGNPSGWIAAGYFLKGFITNRPCT
ncbi:RHS repeat-associated core domain-containing protein [Dactylosporangium sp. NPDC049140]|uniref:RHS repeat-associated core domain-containing protein n=1 Tax=Dactylosporangium sp. NPDC049140 TaxID=3155647 RepID=UPI0033FDBB40